MDIGPHPLTLVPHLYRVFCFLSYEGSSLAKRLFISWTGEWLNGTVQSVAFHSVGALLVGHGPLNQRFGWLDLISSREVSYHIYIMENFHLHLPIHLSKPPRVDKWIDRCTCAPSCRRPNNSFQIKRRNWFENLARHSIPQIGSFQIKRRSWFEWPIFRNPLNQPTIFFSYFPPQPV